MKLFIITYVLISLSYSYGKEYNVSNFSDLSNAIKKVAAGDTIYLADGVYLGRIKLNNTSGTADKPITIKGSKKAIIDAGNLTTGRSISMYNVSYWILDGFTLTNALQGIVLDYSKNNILTNLYVHHTGIEAVHIRFNSTDNIIQNSTISYTGRTDVGRGEGVYIGLAVIYWNGYPDTSNRNKVLYNHFGPYVTAESVDIKEGTSDNLIHGNYFDGTGMSGEHAGDSWVDCKGYNNTISNNFGIFSFRDGFTVHDQRHFPEYAEFVHMFPSGCENVFKNNVCSSLNHKLGKCIQFRSVTACSNEDINNITV